MQYTRKSIQNRYHSGKKMKFLFFWGHQKHPSGEITASCFSQWWAAEFTVDGIKYPTAEHWMMAEKARLFGDNDRLAEILATRSPGKAKQIGREVRGFNQQIWEEKRSEIVVEGNFHKFNQHLQLKAFLLNTKKRVLVEASPADKIWGIGLDANHEFAAMPPKWRGLNLLGFALMEVRDRLNTE